MPIISLFIKIPIYKVRLKYSFKFLIVTSGPALNVPLTSSCSNDIILHFNDRASSIETYGNCVILCEHRDCEGRCFRFENGCTRLDGCCGDHKFFNKESCGANDIISSSRACCEV
uniref:Defensin-like protein n=1 Tax=Rhabditophanes sp. KR3021 TaxID=114890 RepID=A0AC35TU17_9BILA